MNGIDRAKELLLSDPSVTCAFVRGEEERVSRLRGVDPLLELLDAGETLEGFSAADRVVGGAAALLYVLLGAKEVYAEVLGRRGKEIFESRQIACGYRVLTEQIVRRTGDGPCPMEAATEGISDPVEGLMAIRKKRMELRGG